MKVTVDMGVYCRTPRFSTDADSATPTGSFAGAPSAKRMLSRGVTRALTDGTEELGGEDETKAADT
jgi:hypothetical protein